MSYNNLTPEEIDAVLERLEFHLYMEEKHGVDAFYGESEEEGFDYDDDSVDESIEPKFYDHLRQLSLD